MVGEGIVLFVEYLLGWWMIFRFIMLCRWCSCFFLGEVNEV